MRSGTAILAGMKILSVLAHPRTDSFCHVLSREARLALEGTGHTVRHHDLYAEGFDPILKAEEAYTIGDDLEIAMKRSSDPVVREHRAELGTTEGLLIVHPNWWGKPPAILAGWIDRVFVPGVAYRLETADGLPEGLLNVRTALVLNTSDTHEEREERELGDPLESIWGRCVLPYNGVSDYRREVFRPVVDSDPSQRSLWLAQTRDLAVSAFS